MTSKHTPGPWHVGVKQAHRIIYDQAGWAVADATVFHGRESQDEMIANARLIASAPDLLAALELIHANAAESPEWIRARIDAAIAKARGE
jgi:hypothetical protein